MTTFSKALIALNICLIILSSVLLMNLLAKDNTHQHPEFEQEIAAKLDQVSSDLAELKAVSQAQSSITTSSSSTEIGAAEAKDTEPLNDVDLTVIPAEEAKEEKKVDTALLEKYQQEAEKFKQKISQIRTGN